MDYRSTLAASPQSELYLYCHCNDTRFTTPPSPSGYTYYRSTLAELTHKLQLYLHCNNTEITALSPPYGCNSVSMANLMGFGEYRCHGSLYTVQVGDYHNLAAFPNLHVMQCPTLT